MVFSEGFHTFIWSQLVLSFIRYLGRGQTVRQIDGQRGKYYSLPCAATTGQTRGVRNVETTIPLCHVLQLQYFFVLQNSHQQFVNVHLL